MKSDSGWEEAYSQDFSGSSGKGPRPIVVSYASSPAAELGQDGKPRTKALLDTCYRQVEYAGVLANGKQEEKARKEFESAIGDVEGRAAKVRAGYVYVISNLGAFGERMVKVGLTRRLDPQDRIRELSDASVPFNFDIHALFFAKDAVGIELALHARLAAARVNIVNRRREFFRASPVEVKAHLAELAGELLEFQEIPEALEYRQCLTQTAEVTA